MDSSECGAASRYGESELVIPLWKVGLLEEGSRLSGLSSRLAKQASRLRSSRPRPGWSRCCGWSPRACFRQVLSILHLPPSPRLASGAGIQLAGATLCPPHSFKDPSGPGLAFPGTVVSGPTKGKPATLPESSAPADCWPRSAQSPESPGPKPQHQASLLGTMGPIAEPRCSGCTLSSFPQLRLILSSLPSHEGRPPTRVSASRAQPDVAGTTLGSGCL